MAGGGGQGRRPAGAAMGWFSGGVIRQRQQGQGLGVSARSAPGDQQRTGSKPLKRGGAPMPTDITDKGPFRQFCQLHIRGFSKIRGVRLAVRFGNWWQPGAPERGLIRWYGWRSGSGPEASRGCRGLVPRRGDPAAAAGPPAGSRAGGGVIRQRQHGRQPWGYVVLGYLPGRQVITRNRGVRLVVRSGNWRQPGAPERGLVRWYGWRWGSGPEASRGCHGVVLRWCDPAAPAGPRAGGICQVSSRRPTAHGVKAVEAGRCPYAY